VFMLLLPVVFSLGLGLGWLLWGAGSSETVQQANDPGPAKRFDVALDDDYVLGPADAPITIIEFSDYQCPYCVRWYEQVYQLLMQEYAGKIRFVYRDFPLISLHPDAAPAANAANCAGEQNAYYQFHDALFSNQLGLVRHAYIQYATSLGLDVDAFQTCLDEERYAGEVEADMRYGYSIGVSSTPTFYINGLAVVGAQPYEIFQQIIEQELAGN